MKVPMTQHWQGRVGMAAVAFLACLGGWMIVAGSVSKGDMRTGSAAALRRPNGQAQLISVETIPAMAGEECVWEPAGFEPSELEPAGLELNLMASLQQSRSDAARAQRPDSRKQMEVQTRKPKTIIKDNYSAFSSVAVDMKNDEVVMTDESMFKILTYNRLANTPASAAMTEPKRVIAGLKTEIEFECGVYIDPESGDIYTVNNDTLDTLKVFSRNSNGDVAPIRHVETPHTTFGIAVDETHQELSLSVQEAAAVVTYRKTASGDEAPIRVLQGDKTRLADPHGMALDTEKRILYVANFGTVKQHRRGASGGSVGGERYNVLSSKPNWPLARESAVMGTGRFEPASITVYSHEASGDVAPVRMISGPKTQLNWPTGLALDLKRGELFVANDGGNSVLVFDAHADGDVAPRRVIKGPKSMIKNPTGIFYDYKNEELWVANFGNHTTVVFKPSASGDAAPIRMIRSAPLSRPTPNIANAFAVAYDSKRDEILVPN